MVNNEFTYYCEVNRDWYAGTKGIYTYTSEKNTYFKFYKFLELMEYSDKVWRQGPRGGVKVVKSRYEFVPSQYVTTDENVMKQFMWVKLQAQLFN